MNYEAFFVSVKKRVIHDLGDNFNPSVLDQLSLALNYQRPAQSVANDQYRSRAARVPAFYNPNTHTVHLNVRAIESTNARVIENIYYHELAHATAHHARIQLWGMSVLKSGLKIQMWDEDNRPTTLNRGLNEGLTQYFANSYTAGGPAYRHEVEIIGRLVQKIGLADLKAAYFGSEIDKFQQRMATVFGENFFNDLSVAVDGRHYEIAEDMIN